MFSLDFCKAIESENTIMEGRMLAKAGTTPKFTDKIVRKVKIVTGMQKKNIIKSIFISKVFISPEIILMIFPRFAFCAL
jgi:hypothetical protein